MSSPLSEIGEPGRTGTLLRIPAGRPGAQAEGAARRMGRPASRRTSRLAQPLITALGAFTLLAGGSFVTVATATAGSAQPLDWLRLDWSLVGSHARACLQDHRGPDAIGCVLSPVSRPAPAASVSSEPESESQATGPLYSTAMVPDQPSAPPTRRPAKPTSGHPGGSTTWPAADAPAVPGVRSAPGAVPGPAARPTAGPTTSPTPGWPDE